MKSALVVLATLAALGGTAAAGTVSGTITEQAGGAPIASAEVRIWIEGTKGYSIAQTVAANGSGGYSFTVGAGNYKVDARGPAGSGANYGDRWYDAAAPSSSGYVGENADVLAVTAASNTVGVDIALEVLGGIDGTVFHSGATPAPNMWVRFERRGEIRIHHNDFTDAPTGLVSFRGAVPATDYQVITYDPAGVRDTLLTNGPFTITSNANGSLPNLVMANAPADPNEGNNTASCGQVSIDAVALHMDPPQPWASTGARVGPLASSDVDWYCFTAVDGDRLFITATTELTFNGATRNHPWTDPLLSFWRGARVTRLVENDDFGGTFDARVDTGPLTAGCHCAAVTTFGDANYVGAGQNSTGAYQLRVVQGNRPPVPSIKKGMTEVPAAPATFSIDEGDTLVLDLSYRDADHDVPTKSFTHTDAMNNAVAGGTLVLNAETGSYTWMASATAATGSPYTLRLTAGDGEFQMTKTVTLIVRDVNMPPPVPVPIAPIGGAVVMTGAPPLSWQNAADPEANVVTYDVELYADDTTGVPAQVGNGIAEGAAGTTMWTPATIAENTRVFWRVRARDSLGGLSPWSEYAEFLVDSANDPPDQPILLKPAENEIIAMRRPGLSVLNVDDPEDESLEYVFEIASDSNFGMIVWTSAGIPENTTSATTMTGTTMDLVWGGDYFARVKARDARGAESLWSDAHHFRLKPNLPPSDPAWNGACTATTYDTEPPSEIVVRNVDDPEGEPVTFELEVFRFDDNPQSSFPVYQTSAMMMGVAGGTTAIPVDLSGLENGRYRYFVRAFDGTDASGSIECELTLDLPGSGDPSGGCCDSGSRPPVAPIGTAFILLFVLRRRRARC